MSRGGGATRLGAAILAAVGWAPGLFAADTAAVPWPGFRGVGAAGLGDGKTPLTWNVPAGEGVLWKAEVPGLGHSSPVLTRDLVCVTTAISGQPDATLRVGLYGDIAPVVDESVHQFQVHCLDRKTGVARFVATAARGRPPALRLPRQRRARRLRGQDRPTHLSGTPR